MRFGTPTIVNEVIYAMLQADQPRARNRSRILQVFNGDPPYTETEALENNHSVNVNFLEGTRIITSARAQWENAFQKPGQFFNCKVDVGPRFLRQQNNSIITREIARVMKRSPKYMSVLKSQGAQFMLNGQSPVSWIREEDWCPKAVGVEDLLIPSNTLTDFSNLTHFAIYTTFTVKDLMSFIKDRGKAKQVGWNVPMVGQIIEALLGAEQTQIGVNDDAWNWQFPEKIEENYKANCGYWGTDSAPTLRCYDFYYINEDKEGKAVWNRRIVIDPYAGYVGEKMAKAVNGQFKNVDPNGAFLFDPGDKSYGDDLGRMLHVLIGNGAVKAPFRYHSVRSLGYLLYSVCHLQNRTRCAFSKSVFENMMWIFRNVAEGDKERLEKVDLHDLGIIPQGLEWVPNDQRHQVDFGLLSGALSQNRQLMSESSASFVSDADNGTSKEMTAFETMIRANQSSALVGSLLNDSYTQKAFEYREIARRFCTSDSEDCKKFRQRCQREGVPAEVWKDFDAWEIEPERVMGAGNKALEIAQSDRLMAIIDRLPQTSQKIVLRSFITANTDDPRMADTLQPLDGEKVNKAQEQATLAWGTLIDGKPVLTTESLNEVDYINTLIELLNMELGTLEQLQQLPDQRRLLGLQNVLQHIEAHVQIVAADPMKKQLVSEWMDVLGRAANMVKAMAQQLEEQQQADQGQQMSAEQQKLQAQAMASQLKLETAAMSAEQKRVNKELDHVQKQQRMDEAAQAQIQRTNAQTMVDLRNQAVRTDAEVANKRRLADAAETASSSAPE